ncbi:MAG: hypothetical protein MJ252_07095 [archaeon]|nr:hypothetical protein [archaeon]
MFMIISPDDSQVYEMKTTKKEITYIHELVAYSSLDLIENSEWTTNTMNLKQVDKFNDFSINCFVSPGSKIISFIS